jgi:hypothetical protein
MHHRPDLESTAGARSRVPASRAAAALALAAGMLAGCEATLPNTAPRYVEPPASVGAAKVRVVNTHPFAYYADIAVFDSPTCFAKANLGMTGGNSHDAERIGMLDDRPVSAGTLERTVLAGEALVIGPRAVFPTVTNSEIMHSLMPGTQDERTAPASAGCPASCRRRASSTRSSSTSPRRAARSRRIAWSAPKAPSRANRSRRSARRSRPTNST